MACLLDIPLVSRQSRPDMTQYTSRPLRQHEGNTRRNIRSAKTDFQIGLKVVRMKWYRSIDRRKEYSNRDNLSKSTAFTNFWWHVAVTGPRLRDPCEAVTLWQFLWSQTWQRRCIPFSCSATAKHQCNTRTPPIAFDWDSMVKYRCLLLVSSVRSACANNLRRLREKFLCCENIPWI